MLRPKGCGIFVGYDGRGGTYPVSSTRNDEEPKKSMLPDREVILDSSTGYSKNRFYLPTMRKGMKVAIVDDIISTGGTAKALVGALRDMGVIVTEIVCLLNKSKDPEALQKEIGVPIKAVVIIEVKDGKARPI